MDSAPTRRLNAVDVGYIHRQTRPAKGLNWIHGDIGRACIEIEIVDFALSQKDLSLGWNKAALKKMSQHAAGKTREGLVWAWLGMVVG